MSPATIVPFNWIHQHGVSLHSFSFAVLFSILLPLPLLVSIYRHTRRRGGGGSPSSKSRATRLPPSPPGLPIIGNLHQLSSLPHRSLRSLSRQHGPLMLLHLGQVPTLVVSSAAAAEEVMKAHDVAFAGRPSLAAGRALERGGRTISFTPYGDYWRQAKKACVVHLLNPRRVRAFRPVREEEVARLLAAVAGQSSNGAMDLSRALSSFTNAMISRALFGREHAVERSSAEKIAELIGMNSALLGGFQVDDFFPTLAWLTVLTGKNSKLKELARNWYAFLDGMVDGHVSRMQEKEATEEDFVDVLLSLQGGADGDFVPSIAEIKVILMDLISAGTDTSYEVLEWAMA